MLKFGRLAARVLVVCGIVTAGWPVGTAAARILGVEAFDGPLPFYDANAIQTRARTDDDAAEPLELLLARSRYRAGDGHLEVVVLLAPPEDLSLEETWLSVRLLDAAGGVQYVEDVPVPGRQMAFYPSIPDGLLGVANLEVTWRAGERELAAATGQFRVERSAPPALSGRVALRVANPSGAVVSAMPLSAGVPFPRGVLADMERLRLVDEAGDEIRAQFAKLGRWSKYGSIKWVHCDFTADFAGGAREFFVEYGPQIRAAPGTMLVPESTDGFPRLDAGRLRFDSDGLWFDAEADGRYVQMLKAAALTGGFVEHEDGRIFRMPADGVFRIDEQGSEKVVLQREGWYREPDGDAFCQYEVRWVVYRDSPVARVFFTWIFTGDGDSDRIRNMGWRLALPDDARPGGFLSSFGESGRWLDGNGLLQHDHDAFAVLAAGLTAEHEDGRSPGVARVSLDGAEMYFGARDFWQAFPSELEFRDGALWFHNWPRHGRPRPEPLVDPDRATLLDFAHTGSVLDLRLPEAYTEDPLDRSHSHGREGSTIWLTGQPESVNAQGLARTEEFWLYLAPSTEPPGNAARVLAGIQSETLRAVVDPGWVVGSGVFHEAHPLDREQFGLFESIYEATGALLDIERIERVGLYGMWLHGEALWDWGGYGHLGNLYRQLRKGHGGYWRLCWLPYARSGDPRLLKHHDAAMRRMIDANFCHYVSERVAQKAAGRGDIVRRPAFWSRGSLPWAGRSLGVLDYERQPHQWWSAWHMTGYHRAHDMALRYPQLARTEALHAVFSGGNRGIESVQKAFVDSYENTFDPWFLPWMHALARQHRDAWAADRWQPYGRYWMPGDREFHRFTGCPAHGAYFADLHPHHNYTWHITRDANVLRRRVAALMEMEESGTRIYGRQHHSSEWVMTLGVIARAQERPPPLHAPFPQRLRAFEEVGDEKVFRTPPVAFRKAEGEALPVNLRLIRLQTYQRENDTRIWWIYGPDGREFMRGDLSIGTFDNQPGKQVVIPADAPAGVYHLFCEMRSTDPRSDRTSGYALRGLYYPVTPPGTPEVIVNTEERMGPAGFSVDTPGYYFHVPASVSELRIQNIHSHYAAAIRDADGKVVWQHPERGSSNAGLSIPPAQRGRLWRIRGGDFEMDPQIAPYYAVDPDRWFDYSAYATPEYPLTP